MVTNTSAVKHSPDGSAQRLTEQQDGQWDKETKRQTVCWWIEAKHAGRTRLECSIRGVACGGKGHAAAWEWKTKRRENPFAHKMRHSVHYFNVTDKSFLCRC